MLIISLFLLKILAGILLGWMSQKFYPQGNDYWGLHIAGMEEYRILISDPKLFFKDIFINPYQNGFEGFFHSSSSYWNDLKNMLLIKFLAFCNIFSRGNYYINSLFFNFIGFFGHVAFYRVFADIFKNKKWPVIIGCFLLPSTLYFTAGIHKDLFVFSLLGMYFYAFYFSLQSKMITVYFLTIVVTFTGLLLLRNFVALSIIPASIAYIISKKVNLNKIFLFISTYSLAFLMLFLLHIIKPAFQPLKIITDKQQEFFALPVASSQLNTAKLEPAFSSFIKNLPQALNHSLLRPYLLDPSTKFLIPLSIELFIYQVLCILMLFSYTKNKFTLNAFILFGLFFSFSLLLFTGYIVPNTGSIVRYRSIYLPLLITPVLCNINWNKFKWA